MAYERQWRVMNSYQTVNPKDLGPFLLLLALPVINFLALAKQEANWPALMRKTQNLFSLHFERMRLEQEKKIPQLKQELNPQQAHGTQES